MFVRSDNPLEWKPSWDWERELSDELMIEAYLKAKWRCGVETVTTAGWEGSEKGERFLAIPNKSNTHASFGAWIAGC